MGFQLCCVVVKFHDKEKYAAAVRSGNEKECVAFAAYCRGLYHDTPYIKFGVYSAGVYDAAVDIERRGGKSVYENLPLM